MADKKTFRDLIAWQKSIQLTRIVYQVTKAMPDAERFGLISQMRRAAVSIASNIAEGNARQTLSDYIHFLVIAHGSLAELETQITIARELQMLQKTGSLVELLEETDRLVQGLIRSLQNKRKENQRH